MRHLGGNIMKNIKFYNVKRRFVSLALAGTLFASVVGLSGCGKKNDNKANVENETTKIETMYENTNEKLEVLVPEMNDEITDNATLMLLFDLIVTKDANGKINAENISKFKSRIDADNIVQSFNNFLDELQRRMITEEKVVRVSTVLPKELENDKAMLSAIETIVDNILKSNTKEEALNEFNKIYSFFALGTRLSVNGKEFKLSDLNLVDRAIANNYAEAATIKCRDYLTDDQVKVMDKVLNDQNNKAEIRTRLEVSYNLVDSKSSVDVEKVFNKKYKEINALLNGKVNLSKETVKNLVNYVNIKYLDSDKISIEDKNKIVGDYTNEKINDALLAIDAIQTYNLNNQKSIIPFSYLLVDEYLKTDTGKIDKTALDFVQFNAINLVNTQDKAFNEKGEVEYNRLRNNPYFENIFKYFTKSNFTHIKKENSKEVKNNIIWQEIGNGAHFINDEVILLTLNKLPKNNVVSNNIGIAESNLHEIIAAIQKSINGECVITDYKTFTKNK